MAIEYIVQESTLNALTQELVDLLGADSRSLADWTEYLKTIEKKSSSDLSASGAAVTVPAGYYAANASKSVATASRATTTLTSAKDTTNNTLTFTASNNQSTGYVTGSNSTTTKTVSLSASGATVTASDGTNSISKSVTIATRANTTISAIADDTTDTITVTGANNQSTGYVTGSNKTASDTITLTQNTPTINSSTGVVTASAFMTDSVSSKSVSQSQTLSLTTQAGKTVTPSSSEQTAVSSGVYTTGAIKVAAVPTETKSVAPSTSAQTVTPSTGKFLSSVSVSAIATETKTVSPSATAQTVTPTSGKYLTKVTVNAIPTVTQAKPSISVSSSGLITASATQSAGYVSSGTKSATKQLTTKSAQTYTPTTSNQTISSGRYLTGTQTIKGDSNLVASNIKKGVSIFGVAGAYEGGGMGSAGDIVTVKLSLSGFPEEIDQYGLPVFIATIEYDSSGYGDPALLDIKYNGEYTINVGAGSVIEGSLNYQATGAACMYAGDDFRPYGVYFDSYRGTFFALTVPYEDVDISVIY